MGLYKKLGLWFLLPCPFTCKIIEMSKEVKNILGPTNGTRKAHAKSQDILHIRVF
jgi:hypothetical protein